MIKKMNNKMSKLTKSNNLESNKMSLKKTKNHTFIKIISWFFAIIAVLIVLGISVFSYLTAPVSKEENAVSEKIRIPDGTSIPSVAQELKDKKLIKSSNALYFAARFNLFDRNSNFVLKSGVYTIKNSMSLKEIYNLLQSGEQEYIAVAIPEGLTITKIANLLEENDVCSKYDFINACHNQNLLQEYNLNAESFEGYLFPDTYFFTPNMEAREILNLMIRNFYEKLSEIPNSSNLTADELYQKIILASIIEREYRIPEEAVLISSVFTNRMKYNIGLYSCATIEYIITEIQGRPHPKRITYDDLKINSPYNTYKYAGLPPSPISNPGKISLNAAINPAKTSYYYFVLSDPKTGRHTFSDSFDEHIAAENLNYISK